MQPPEQARGDARMRQAEGPDVIVLSMWAEAPVAEWPGPGETAIPWPAAVGDGPVATAANARWTVDWCPLCRRHQANLCLTTRVPRHGPVVVDAAPHVAGRCHLD
eukprot:4676398-Alexandrium_andersonii.AAC.1